MKISFPDFIHKILYYILFSIFDKYIFPIHSMIRLYKNVESRDFKKEAFEFKFE